MLLLALKSYPWQTATAAEADKYITFIIIISIIIIFISIIIISIIIMNVVGSGHTRDIFSLTDNDDDNVWMGFLQLVYCMLRYG